MALLTSPNTDMNLKLLEDFMKDSTISEKMISVEVEDMPEQRRREVQHMDSYFEGLQLSPRAFRFTYVVLLLMWFLVAFLLIRLVILEVSRASTVNDNNHDTGASQMSLVPEQTFVLPDMAKIMKWGYGGASVKVEADKLHPVLQEEYEKGLQKNAFNQYVSDRISMRRPLADVRHTECLKLTPRQDPLPSASVIIVFRDEPWTTLLRTVYSVMDRSPEENLKEVILVDDGSTLEVLHYPRLEHYLSVLQKVRIIRIPAQVGVARALTVGTQNATGDALIFLQPHCECSVGWLRPLLERIASKSSEIVLPVVDTIHYDTFEHIPQTMQNMNIGSFTWELTTKRRYLTNSISSEETILQSPMIVAGIFAVNRRHFYQLGGFDESLTLEDSVFLELSLRAWMCSGGIAIVLCSHVGYVFPKPTARLERPVDEDTASDRLRIAKTWMNEFEDFVYERLPLSSAQMAQIQAKQQGLVNMRENLVCHNFSWYLQNLEPTKLLKGSIIKRGTINHIVLNVTVLSVAAEDNVIILQDWYIKPIPIWYLMDSGQLQNGDGMCVVLGEAASGEKDMESDMPQALPAAPPVMQQVTNQSRDAEMGFQPFHDLQPEDKFEEVVESKSKEENEVFVDQNEIQPEKLMISLRKTLENKEPDLRQLDSPGSQNGKRKLSDNRQLKKISVLPELRWQTEEKIAGSEYIQQEAQRIQTGIHNNHNNQVESTDFIEDKTNTDPQQDSGDLSQAALQFESLNLEILPQQQIVQEVHMRSDKIRTSETEGFHPQRAQNTHEYVAGRIQPRRQLSWFQEKPFDSELRDTQPERRQDQANAGDKKDIFSKPLKYSDIQNVRESGLIKDEGLQNIPQPEVHQIPKPDLESVQRETKNVQIEANEIQPAVNSTQNENHDDKPKSDSSLLKILTAREPADDIPLPRHNKISSSLSSFSSVSSLESSAKESEGYMAGRSALLLPCEQVQDGDKWILTESGTLRNKDSGFCMEAQKTSVGSYEFQMVKCDGTSQAQKWSFTSRYKPR